MRSIGTDIQWLYEGLAQCGVPRNQIDGKLANYSFAGADRYLAINDYIDLFEWGTQVLAQPHLSLLLAKNYQSKHFGAVGYLSKVAPNLKGFYRLVETYQALVMEGKGWRLHTGESKSELEYVVPALNSEQLRLDVELSVSLVVEQIRREFDRDWQPIQINFRHKAQSPEENYVRFLGDHVNFTQARNSIILDNDLLTQPLNDSDPRLLNILVEHANHEMQKIQHKPDFIQKTQIIMMANLENSEFTINDLAEHLSVTARTLHRRLQKHGTSFRQLREGCMADVAKELLETTDMPVTLVAQQLGYSETSAFIRAFKRLVGASPRQYRQEKSASL